MSLTILNALAPCLLIARWICLKVENFVCLFSNSDWDKCRSLCPVAKPSPPTLPGAQLILDVPESGSDLSVDHKEWRQLWEDELITYKC